MGMPRLVLVEWLSTDRYSQYRSSLYAFIRGLALAEGVPVRWVCFGFDAATHLDGLRALSPPAADLQQLAAILTEHHATHGLSNEQLSVPLSDRFPDVAWHCERDEAVSANDVLRWLGLPPADHYQRPLVDAVRPRYQCELENELAESITPLVRVVSGPHCLFAADVTRQPAFAGVELGPASLRRLGCSFCGHDPEKLRYRFETPAVELALAQIDAVVATANNSRHPREFEIIGAAVFRHLEAFVGGVLEARVPPSAFYFAARIDEILAHATTLERLLPRLQQASHTIHFANVGAENLSATENDRLNKHISKEQVGEFLGLMRRWHQTWPETLVFQAHGGFGFIMFTPWTTIRDLRINAEALRDLNLRNPEFCTTSRLLLIHGRPITELARRDGLTAARFADPLLSGFCEAGCLTEWGQEEIPWRFAHAEIGPILSVLLRWRPETASDDDPLATDRERLRDLAPAWPNHVAFFEAVIDAADVDGDRPTTVAALLDNLEAELPAHQRSSHRARVMERITEVVATTRRDTPGGFTASVRRGRDGHPEVTLTRDDECVRLQLPPAASTPRAYLFTSSVAIVHASDTPIDTPDKETAVWAFARALDANAHR